MISTYPVCGKNRSSNCTEVRFASFFSGEFTTMVVMNSPEKKLEKRTSLNWFNLGPFSQVIFDDRRQRDMIL